MVIKKLSDKHQVVNVAEKLNSLAQTKNKVLFTSQINSVYRLRNFQEQQFGTLHRSSADF